VTGSGTLRGHDVYWLRFKPVRSADPLSRDAKTPFITDVAVDRKTYEPVFIRDTAPGRSASTSAIGHIEGLAGGQGDFRLSMASSLGPTSASVTETELIDAATAGQRLQAPPVYHADRLAGLSLRAIRAQTINQTMASGAADSAVGVQFIYGDVDPEVIGSGLLASGALRSSSSMKRLSPFSTTAGASPQRRRLTMRVSLQWLP
jgi:hypothetical protein